MDKNQDQGLQAHLTEFRALREEIKQRSYFQHTYLVLLFTAYGAIASFSLREAGRRELLIITPFVSLVLYSLWTHQAKVIQEIALYIANKISPETSSMAGHPVLQWEDKGRKFRLPPREQKLRRGTYLAAHALLSLGFPSAANLFAFPAASESLTLYSLWALGWVAILATFYLYLQWHGSFYRGPADETGAEE